MDAYTLPLVVLAISLLVTLISSKTSGVVAKTLRALGYGLLVYYAVTLWNTGIIDNFSLVLSVASATICLIVGFYADAYATLFGYGKTLSAQIDLFATLLVVGFASPNILVLASAWTLAEIAAYLLIKTGEEHSYEGSLTSSRGFIFTSTLTTEISVFTAIVVSIYIAAATLALSNLLKPFGELSSSPVPIPSPVIPLLLLGFVTKMALVPLHFWLPGAHSSAPAPASALLSGVATQLGFYGLYRILSMFQLGGQLGFVAILLATMGLASVVYATLQITSKRDGKMLLAYSTIATNGFTAIIFAVALVRSEFMPLFLLAMLMHMAYKTTLFAEIGLVEYVYGTRYIHKLAQAARSLRVSSIGGVIAVFSLLGVPGTLGFSVKALSVFAVITGMLSEGLTPLLAEALIGIVTYILSSIIVGLRFLKIYSPSAQPVLPQERAADTTAQLPVAVLGLANLFLGLALALYSTDPLVLVLTAVSPFTILVALITWSYLVKGRVIKVGH